MTAIQKLVRFPYLSLEKEVYDFQTKTSHIDEIF